MPIGVTIPQNKGKEDLGKLLAIGGAVAGGFGVGGLAGGLSGAAQGLALGQAAGSLLSSNQAPEAMGMQRRTQQLDQNNLGQLREAQAALASLPPDQLPQTRKVLEQAFALSQRNQQIGRV